MSKVFICIDGNDNAYRSYISFDEAFQFQRDNNGDDFDACSFFEGVMVDCQQKIMAVEKIVPVNLPGPTKKGK